jgi:hypothetical protein
MVDAQRWYISVAYVKQSITLGIHPAVNIHLDLWHAVTVAAYRREQPLGRLGCPVGQYSGLPEPGVGCYQWVLN